MEELKQNKKTKYIKHIIVYIAIPMANVVINLLIFIYLTFYITLYITKILFSNVGYLEKQQPLMLFDGLNKIFSIAFVVNLLLLLIIEFIIMMIFQKKLNILFKRDNLFTIKNYLIIACASIMIQIIFSCLFWTGNMPSF